MGRLSPEERTRRDARIQELTPIVLELDTEYGRSNKWIAKALNERGVVNLEGKAWTAAHVSNFKQRYLSVKPTSSSSIAAIDEQAPSTPEQHTSDMSTIKPESPQAQLETCNIPVVDNGESVDAATSNSIPAVDLGSEETANADTTTAFPPWDDKLRDQLPVPVFELTGDAGERGQIAMDVTEAVENLEDDIAIPQEPEVKSTPTLHPDVIALLNRLHGDGSLTTILTKGEVQPMPQKRPTFAGDRVNSGLLLNRKLKDATARAAKNENLSLSQLVELLMWRHLGSGDEYVE